MDLIEIEVEKLIPLTDDVISSGCARIHSKLHKIPESKNFMGDIAHRGSSRISGKYIDILIKHH
jgi:hypothetical protein